MGVMKHLTFRYYINPISYGLKILSTNEFLSEKYGPVGKIYLKEMGFPTNQDNIFWWYAALIIIHITCKN